MVGVDDWEAGVHPPPDLAIEIDVASSSVNREAIYAALGVPEIWRFDGRRLTFRRLRGDGAYESVASSSVFAFLRSADLLPFLVHDPPVSETRVLQQFDAWVQEQIVARSPDEP